MARISSTTLFNFTDSIDFLLDNLKNGIYCHNTYEKLPFRNKGYRVPMACFCDIPLSLIKEHFDWYGRYGIGIKRTYARKLGVKPVWYVTSESNLVRNLIKNKTINEYERKYLVPYLKQFIGNQFYQKEQREKRKKFYDEREWRFIPDNSKVELFFNSNSLKNDNTVIQNGDRMPIDLKEIEYIIIKKEDDFEILLKELNVLSNTHKIKYEKLISKIITAKQIEKDF